jgi:hypothetical protein
MPLESPVQRDGDAGFIGFASRLNPITLPAGVLQASENMRLDRGVATTRKGAKRMASGVAPANAPLTVPFNLAVSEGTNDPVVKSVYDGGVFASAVVRSPDAVNSFELVVLAAAAEAYIQSFDDGSGFSATWGSGPILATNSPDPDEGIVTNAGEEILSTILPDTLTYPAGETIEQSDKVSMLQAFNRLYLFREASTLRDEYRTNGITAGGITVSGTTATVNCAGHGYSANMRVRIEGSTVAAFDGVEYDVATAATDTFTITVPSGTAQDTTITGRTVRRVKAPLYWDLDPTTDFVRSPAGVPSVGATYKSLPSAPWAVYTNNRLVVPSGRDGVLLSDWLDPEVYDPFWSSFRANQGSNDFLVAVQPWVEGAFLVFMRKSIWLATVNQFASTDGSDFAIDTPLSKLEMLTDEVGCLARNTVAVAGQYVFFLSDAGVYRLDAARLDLKLRGNTRPLSDPIADQFEQLDPSAAANSVGVWHDNRYWLAVPQAAGANPQAWLFVWSALNEQWETRDNYGFGIDGLLVATAASRRRVMATSQAGTIMMLNEVEAGDDAPDPAITDYAGTVSGRIVTRRYGMGSMHNKRFLRSLADVVLPDTASITVKARLTNPDAEITLVPGQTNLSGLSEDYTLKQPIRQKAHYCELEFLTTANRPEIRNVSIEAAGPSLPPTETRNAA